MEPGRLFLAENHETKLRQNVTPLIHSLSEFIFIIEHRNKEVAFADDFTVAGKPYEINT